MPLHRLAVVALLLAAPACSSEILGDPDDCAGKCDGYRSAGKTGILYVPQYDHSSKWRTDGEWGVASAQKAADRLAERGWGEVEVIPVTRIEEMLRDLEARAALELTYDFVGTVSHSTRGGPVFDDPTNARKTVQAGWTWYGFDQPVSTLEDGGPVDLDGLKELTSRLAAVIEPDGRIIFAGCNTARESIASAPRSKPVRSAYAQGTPFFMQGVSAPRRYKTYVHAVADLSGRLTQGANTRMSLGLTADILETLYFGGAGAGTLPSFYTSVLSIGAPQVAIDALDGSYEYEDGEDAFGATGACDEADECATGDASMEAEE
jgi:hypothetical protein